MYTDFLFIYFGTQYTYIAHISFNYKLVQYIFQFYFTTMKMKDSNYECETKIIIFTFG